MVFWLVSQFEVVTSKFGVFFVTISDVVSQSGVVSSGVSQFGMNCGGVSPSGEVFDISQSGLMSCCGFLQSQSLVSIFTRSASLQFFRRLCRKFLMYRMMQD